MAAVLTAQDLSKTFGTRTLFAGVSLALEERERVALIGPNGSGKSTLLKILAGLEHADTGEVRLRRGVRAAYVAQRDEFAAGSTVLSAVTEDLHRAVAEGRVPHLHDEHEADQAAELVLNRLEFADLAQPTERLSGGWRKRLAIARELAKAPDVLLLDEPTNHLDLEGIEWLEGVLRTGLDDGPPASIMITHDREFLETAAERIVELSAAYPQGTFGVDGGYSEFLRRKQEFLDGQARTEQALANQVREDLRWLSRGAKARRTKSKSRIDASHERIEQLAELRQRNAPARAAGLEFGGTGRQTVKLIQARAITKSVGEGVAARRLFTDLDVVITPGTVVGLMGPNGSGKSTLIRVLTGAEAPSAATGEAVQAARDAEAMGAVPPGAPEVGTVRRAERLRVVVFTQARQEIDPSLTLRDALAPQSDSVIYRERTVHVHSWARRFLFTPEQLKMPVRALSGGELARVHLAQLMLEPADVLVLDEPTNDLDLASLEVLEESIEEFGGAVILVTHDRAMLARLATQIVALDGGGGAQHFVSYEEWEESRRGAKRGTGGGGSGSGGRRGGTGRGEEKESGPTTQEAGVAGGGAEGGAAGGGKVKLTYKEQRELDQMEGQITAVEAEIHELEQRMNAPEVLGDHRKLQDVCKRLEGAQTRRAALYGRWEELEAKRG